MEAWERVLDAALDDEGLVVVLTGAGISAESGIPTFRGPEGYWTVGSEVYTPTELATHAMFRRDPARVWEWYLYRLGVCRAANPNPAHDALAAAGRSLGDDFLLITQNVDGLHLRAGSPAARTFEIHGNVAFARCADGCGAGVERLPEAVAPRGRGETLRREDLQALCCGRCGGWLRPHVLWFDETYDEQHFRYRSSLDAAGRARLLVTVGTSAATNLPVQVVRTAVAAGAALIDVNPEPNPFGETAAGLARGAAIRAPASTAVPGLVEHLERR